MTKLGLYFRLVRPQQFIKNGFVLIPLIFGHKLFDGAAVMQTGMAFGIFCLVSGGIYILNDLADIEHDRKHPRKRLRPLAAGQISPLRAVSLMVGLLIFAAIVSWWVLPIAFLVLIAMYVALNVAYSKFLKKFPIVDVVCVALGFVLRVYAGAAAAEVKVTHWLIIITFLLSLFLALAKRRDDLVLLEQNIKARDSISGYNAEFIAASMVLMASVTIVAYLLYAVSPEIVAKHSTDKLFLTGFWVVVGILRYMQITFVFQQSGSPTTVLLNDAFLIIIIGCWVLNCMIVIYLKP